MFIAAIRQVGGVILLAAEDEWRIENGEWKMKSRSFALSAGIFASLALLAPSFAHEPSLAVETIAGVGSAENNGDGGPALEIAIGQPFGVEVGPDGALYITEVLHHRVRRLDLQSGRLSTIAGNGEKGYSGDGGPARKARLNEPYEVRFDADGNIYFVEMQNHLVRRVDAHSGIISTIAGAGRAGFAGDGGPAEEALLSSPHSIALDDAGHLYIADIGNHRIRRVELASGGIETIAGNGEKQLPKEGAIGADKPMLGPRALYFSEGSLWIALREGHSVWRLDLASGKLMHVAGTGERGFSGDGGPAALATFDGPKGIAVGPRGEIVVVDTENNAIRVIDPRTQSIETIAGGRLGAPSSEPIFNRPHGVCVGGDGVIYVGDTLEHVVRRIVPEAARDK